MGRPEQKPQPQAAQPGLKVVEKPAAGQKPVSAPEAAEPEKQQDATQTRAAEAATRRRLHPARVWPD